MILLIFFRFFLENIIMRNLDRKNSYMGNLNRKIHLCIFFKKKYVMGNLDRNNMFMSNLDINNTYMGNLVRK